MLATAIATWIVWWCTCGGGSGAGGGGGSGAGGGGGSGAGGGGGSGIIYIYHQSSNRQRSMALLRSLTRSAIIQSCACVKAVPISHVFHFLGWTVGPK